MIRTRPLETSHTVRAILFPPHITDKDASPIPVDQLLIPLLRTGMTVDLLVNGAAILAQKIVTVNAGVLFTVSPHGEVTATRIDRIDSLTF